MSARACLNSLVALSLAMHSRLHRNPDIVHQQLPCHGKSEFPARRSVCRGNPITCRAGLFRRRDLLPAWVALTCTLTPPAKSIPLAPLGSSQHVGGPKLTGLKLEQLQAKLERDLAEGMYFVTGDLTPEIFADDCRFVDPTNDVSGLSRYITALGLLFDPEYSKVLSRGVRVTGPRTLEADWVLGGYLRFPWKPKIEPLQGHTVYTLNDQGLIQTQEQTWSISPATALLASFTPTFGPRKQLL